MVRTPGRSNSSVPSGEPLTSFMAPDSAGPTGNSGSRTQVHRLHSHIQAALACATAAVHRLTIPAGSGQVPHAALRSTGTSVRAYPWNGDADMFRRRSMDAVTHRVRVAHQPTIIGHFSLFPSVTAYSATPHVSWRVLAVLDTGLRVWDSRSLNRSRRYCVIACSWVHKRVRPGT